MSFMGIHNETPLEIMDILNKAKTIIIHCILLHI